MGFRYPVDSAEIFDFIEKRKDPRAHVDTSGLEAFEYLVVGSGPGGAPAALALAEAGKSVAIVERGAYHRTRTLGYPLGMRVMEFGQDHHAGGVVEGGCVCRGISVGGSSLSYNGNIMEPSDRIFNEMGVNFRQESDELIEEIGIRPLPDRFYEHYTGGMKLFEAADKMGVKFDKQLKAIDPERCRPGCDWCMFGCRHDAKWNTRGMVDRAVAYGARLFTCSKVDQVVFNDRRSRVLGVRLDDGRVIRAQNVILAAGGEGSPAILLRSGVNHLGDQQVGTRFFYDPMFVIMGFADDPDSGSWGEMTFTHAVTQFAKDEGFIIGNCGSLGSYLILNMNDPQILKNTWWKFPFVKRVSSLFVKLGDESNGTVTPDEMTHKNYTDRDWKRGNMGIDLCKEMMTKVGVNPNSFEVCHWLGGHPGGTLGMKQAVNTDFSTEIEGLYVCDGSVIPQSPGVPPVLTITSMGRLLGKYLTGQVNPAERTVSA